MRFLILTLVLALAGCTGPARAIDLPGDPSSPARKLYVGKCAKCHKFYDPARYTDEEWAGWMAKMSRKSKLTADQERMLASYIEQTFRGGRATNSTSTVPRK